MSAVRRSCQTMARCIAWPVARSHTTVVSRWLVMPMAAMSLAVRLGFLQRLAAGGDGRGPDVLGLVLDPARRGKMLREFLLALSRRWRCRRETRSRARMWCPDRWPAQRTWRRSSRMVLFAARQADWGGTSICGGSRIASGGPRPCEASEGRLAERARCAGVPPFAGASRSQARQAPSLQGDGSEIYTDAVVTPPSTTMVCPVMKLDASEAR